MIESAQREGAMKIPPLILLFICGLCCAQDTARDTAVEQMRRVATAIKACPEETTSQTEYAIFHIGPPTNLEWDVQGSKAVRAPFQGIVTFSLPERIEESDKAKHSKKLHDLYMEATMIPLAYPKNVYYQYEFDLGKADVELVKMVVVDAKTKESKPATRDSRCWQKAAGAQ
jgi:hypothetical protein